MRKFGLFVCFSVSFAYCADNQNEVAPYEYVIQRTLELVNNGGVVADLDPDDFQTLSWLVFDHNCSAQVAFELLQKNEENRQKP